MRNRLAVCLGVLLLAALGGCNPPATTVVPDTGPRIDSGPVPQPVVLAAGGTLDLSCVGSVTVPPSGAPVTAALQFQEFLSMAPITSNRVDVFSTNTISDTCVAPDCTSYTTDASGFITATLPADGWFAFSVAESGQTARVISFNQPWVHAAGDPLAFVPCFAPGTISIVGNLLGRTFQADRFGSMSGRAVDCQGHPLQNVRARIYVGDTEIVNGPLGDPMGATVTGLEGTQPTRLGLTGASGNIAGANIPPGDNVRVETWATLTEGELPQLIGCAEGPVVVGGITISIIGGLRSDYPAGSGCATAAANAGH